TGTVSFRTRRRRPARCHVVKHSLSLGFTGRCFVLDNGFRVESRAYSSHRLCIVAGRHPPCCFETRLCEFQEGQPLNGLCTRGNPAFDKSLVLPRPLKTRYSDSKGLLCSVHYPLNWRYRRGLLGWLP